MSYDAPRYTNAQNMGPPQQQVNPQQMTGQRQTPPHLRQPQQGTSPQVPPYDRAGSVRQPPQGTPQMYQQKLYAQEIQMPPSEYACYEGLLNCLGNITGYLGMIPGCCCCPNPMKTVPQGMVGLVTRFGKYYKTVDAGLYYIMPFNEQMIQVDMRIQIEDIPAQNIMTKDNVTVIIDSVLYWHAIDPRSVTFTVSNIRKALVERTMTTLRQITGARTVQECVEHRESMAQEVEDIITPAASSWGIEVESMLIKDLRFSQELQESLSSAAKQKRIGESKIIAAQAEVESAKLMREASDILNTPAAMQIRYLDTLQNMAKTANSKVIFMPGESGHGKGASSGKAGANYASLDVVSSMI